jgi:hypothetical protein
MMRIFLNGGNTVFYEKRNGIPKMCRTAGKSGKKQNSNFSAIYSSHRLMSFAAAKCPIPRIPIEIFSGIGASQGLEKAVSLFKDWDKEGGRSHVQKE